MTQSIPDHVERALAAFESGDLDHIIRAHRPEDFQALRGVATGRAGLPRLYRQKAIYALGRWGDPAVIDDVIAVLPDLDERERMTAIDALGRLGTDRAIEAASAYASDPSPLVRKFVVQALGRAGGPMATDRLREIAATDHEEWVRQLANQHLARSE